MIAPRKPVATVSFVDDYCAKYEDLFPEVRSYECFKYLHMGIMSEIKRKPPQRQREPHRPHVSTARLLAEKQRSHNASTLEKPPTDVVETPATQTLQS